ncbi:MAG TPA: lytic transglycosylase domain-containing protein, partial [Rhizomicrobium sp.]
RFGAAGFLAAYNAGPKRLEDYLAGLRPLRDETERYLAILTQMLPDLQIGVAQPAVRVPTDWRVSGLFIASPTSHSPLNITPNILASQNTTTSQTFALGPQSGGLFVPVRLLDQR